MTRETEQQFEALHAVLVTEQEQTARIENQLAADREQLATERKALSLAQARHASERKAFGLGRAPRPVPPDETSVSTLEADIAARARRVLKVAEATKLQDLDRDFAERIALNSYEQRDLASDKRECLAMALTAVVDGFSAPAHDPDLLRLARTFGCKPEDLEPGK